MNVFEVLMWPNSKGLNAKFESNKDAKATVVQSFQQQHPLPKGLFAIEIHQLLFRWMTLSAPMGDSDGVDTSAGNNRRRSFEQHITISANHKTVCPQCQLYQWAGYIRKTYQTLQLPIPTVITLYIKDLNSYICIRISPLTSQPLGIF